MKKGEDSKMDEDQNMLVWNFKISWVIKSIQKTYNPKMKKDLCSCQLVSNAKKKRHKSEFPSKTKQSWKVQKTSKKEEEGIHNLWWLWHGFLLLIKTTIRRKQESHQKTRRHRDKRSNFLFYLSQTFSHL